MKSAVVAKNCTSFSIILQYFKVVKDDSFYWVIVRVKCEGEWNSVIFFLFVTFVVLTVDQFVERGDGPFELQKPRFSKKDASKPVARHFNVPNHSKEHMSICGLSLHQGTTDNRKNLEQRFIFQIGTVNPHGINERFSFN